MNKKQLVKAVYRHNKTLAKNIAYLYGYKIIISSFFKSINLKNSDGRQQEVRVYVNPSFSEKRSIIEDYTDEQSIRFLIDRVEKKVYMWNGDFLHKEVASKIGKRRNIIGSVETDIRGTIKGKVHLYIKPGIPHDFFDWAKTYVPGLADGWITSV